MNDCACITHNGPHYLHMDAFWKSANHELLEQAARYEESGMYLDALTILRCYDQEELRRLNEKELSLKQCGGQYER